MTPASTRIQWLHKKLLTRSYPNAQRMAERFHMSHRQAQRDIDCLRKKLGAPIAYDNARRGFYYTADYTLPVLLTSDNDESYIPEISAVPERRGVRRGRDHHSDADSLFRNTAPPRQALRR